MYAPTPSKICWTKRWSMEYKYSNLYAIYIYTQNHKYKYIYKVNIYIYIHILLYIRLLFTLFVSEILCEYLLRLYEYLPRLHAYRLRLCGDDESMAQ